MSFRREVGSGFPRRLWLGFRRAINERSASSSAPEMICPASGGFSASSDGIKRLTKVINYEIDIVTLCPVSTTEMTDNQEDTRSSKSEDCLLDIFMARYLVARFVLVRRNWNLVTALCRFSWPDNIVLRAF